MSQLIEEEKTIVDLGCGMMWLKGYLRPGQTYIPVDAHARDESTIVCDFNAGEFPVVTADLAFASGVVEYLKDPRTFFMAIRNVAPHLVLSYCTLDRTPHVPTRVSFGWRNHISRRDLLELVASAGFQLTSAPRVVDNNEIFKFTATPAA